jgi:hypothetical protein
MEPARTPTLLVLLDDGDAAEVTLTQMGNRTMQAMRCNSLWHDQRLHAMSMSCDVLLVSMRRDTYDNSKQNGQYQHISLQVESQSK